MSKLRVLLGLCVAFLAPAFAHATLTISNVSLYGGSFYVGDTSAVTFSYTEDTAGIPLAYMITIAPACGPFAASDPNAATQFIAVGDACTSSAQTTQVTQGCIFAASSVTGTSSYQALFTIPMNLTNQQAYQVCISIGEYSVSTAPTLSYSATACMQAVAINIPKPTPTPTCFATIHNYWNGSGACYTGDCVEELQCQPLANCMLFVGEMAYGTTLCATSVVLDGSTQLNFLTSTTMVDAWGTSFAASAWYLLQCPAYSPASSVQTHTVESFCSSNITRTVFATNVNNVNLQHPFGFSGWAYNPSAPVLTQTVQTTTPDSMIITLSSDYQAMSYSNISWTWYFGPQLICRGVWAYAPGSYPISNFPVTSEYGPVAELAPCGDLQYALELVSSCAYGSPTVTTTPTVTPSATSSSSPTSSATRTASPTPSATCTASPTLSATRTASPTPSATATASVTPSATPSPQLCTSLNDALIAAQSYSNDPSSTIRVNTGALVDSYNSALGSYGGTNLGTQATVLSSAGVNNTGTIKGTVLTNQAPGLTPVPIAADAINETSSYGTWASLNNATLATGDYLFTNLTINGTLTVNGQARIWVTGTLLFNSNAVVNSGASGHPANLEFLVSGTGNADTLNINSGASVAAVLFAPNTPIDVNGTVYGTVVGGAQVVLNSGSAVHYDASLQGKCLNVPVALAVAFGGNSGAKSVPGAPLVVPTQALVVVPNPAASSASAFYRLAAPGFASLKFFSLAGAEALNVDLGEQPAGNYCRRLDLSALADGLYIAVVTETTPAGTSTVGRFKVAVVR